MRIVRHARAGGPPTAVAIGSFDGVHRGHAAILDRLRAAAGARGLAPAVLTFEPLPREFLAPANAPPRLTSLAERLAEIARHGIAIAFVERFGRRFACLDAEAFARRLADEYGARHVLVGEDFRYGAGRLGDVATLRRAGERISSTRVRDALARGDFAEAARLLGRPYAICGRVVHGAKRGKALGFPTANVRLARPRTALAGIFAVKCHGVATRGLEGVASLGFNPAVQVGGPATLEAFLFDFSGDLYGRRICIEFVKKLRDEAHFASLAELAAQIARDCEAARAHFRAEP
jgi:riboflavin kinase/FMN adenylyltransferase